jgi:N utilization substance protein B
VGQRRKARECALQVLYLLDAQLDLAGTARSETPGPSADEVEAVLDEQLRLFWLEETSGASWGEARTAPPAEGGRAGPPLIDADVQKFAEGLVRGVMRERQAIDQLIQSSSRNWRLERMARVDRNVLRLATYELRYLPEIPKRVTLNEAIELAKRFGAEDSGAFINGILDRICQETDKA